MKLAPIIVFAYNRPEHLRKTLEALANNDLANESQLFIYCDGAKEHFANTNQMEEHDAYIARIEETRMVAHKATGFKSVSVIERPQNIGLKANIVGAVTEIVNKYGRVITLEDDIVTSHGFLQFMNEALEMYKDDEQVMHISGYMWPHKWPLPETLFVQVPCPWGWATWKRAWQYYEDDAQQIYLEWKNKWKDFNSFGGNYLQKQLEANYSGQLDTWYVKWHAALLKRNGLTLYPGSSLVDNKGFIDNATNCTPTDKFDVVPIDSVEVKRIPIRESKLAAHEIYAFYQGRWYNKRRRTALFNRIKNIFCFWK